MKTFSNPANSFQERLEFLEETLNKIVKNLKHLGANFSDLDKYPIEQIIAREFSILKCKKDTTPIHLPLRLKNNLPNIDI